MPTSIAPVANIISGNILKHTSNSNFGTLPPVEPTSNKTTLSKSVSPANLPSGGVTDYTITVSNVGTVDVLIDEIIDFIPGYPSVPTY